MSQWPFSSGLSGQKRNCKKRGLGKFIIGFRTGMEKYFLIRTGMKNILLIGTETLSFLIFIKN